VKQDAPALFRKWLGRKGWECEPITMSGVTDPYQPAERQFRITRGCLEVALECRQPLYIITKNAMVRRDLDLFAALADANLVRVLLSVTSLDQSLTRVLEPRTSAPAARLNAISELSKRGVPVVAMVAPIIPGLTDVEVPAILKAVADAGALAAMYTVVRLNGNVAPVFVDWLDRHFPDRKAAVLSRVGSLHGGKINDTRWGIRQRGDGVMADAISTTFKAFRRRYGLDRELPPLDSTSFRPPRRDSQQGLLFD
jgi:DNA repair photolyase